MLEMLETGLLCRALRTELLDGRGAWLVRFLWPEAVCLATIVSRFSRAMREAAHSLGSKGLVAALLLDNALMLVVDS